MVCLRFVDAHLLTRGTYRSAAQLRRLSRAAPPMEVIPFSMLIPEATNSMPFTVCGALRTVSLKEYQ